MDAIIGRYKVRMEESGLVLRHQTGITFDMTLDETVALLDFINAYKQTLMMLQRDADPQTDPQLERIVIKKDDNSN